MANMKMKTPRTTNRVLPLTRVLFTGPAQETKLPAAELIAGQLKLKLYRVDLASVVGKYIGETEKNLDSMFRRAEKSRSLLFFDEADALFGRRTRVKDGHDRYANQEVAYLLRRLETFSGPIIIAANSKGRLPAVWRKRFSTVIRFPRQPKSSAKSNGTKSRAPHRH